MKDNFPIYMHIYNRGVDKRVIFKTDADRNRFMLALRLATLENAPSLSLVLRKREKGIIPSIKQLNLNKLYGPAFVDLLAFSLMPNHYHVLIRAGNKTNVAKFTQRLSGSYTRYFNTKHQRKGVLFESKYHTVQVKTDEQLVHVTRYIHTNPSNSPKLSVSANELKKYQWSSLPAYLKGESKMCDIQTVLSFFANTKGFWEFTKAGIHKEEPLNKKLLID